MLKDLVLKNRSYRKFFFNKKISQEKLLELIDLARLTPSSKNRQPLKYIPVTDPNQCKFIGKHLRWAWFLKEWNGPSEEEQPPAYIVVVLETELNDRAEIDMGITSQTILLGAVESGFGGCIIRTVNKYEVAKYFSLNKTQEVAMVIALGYPNQTVQLTDLNKEGETTYFENDSGEHYVPKRALQDLLILPKVSK